MKTLFIHPQNRGQMTNKLLHFLFLMGLIVVASNATQAQKFLEKGDLKPVIDNLFVWHVTYTAVEIDHSDNSGMGEGTIENDVSGGEGSSVTEENTDNSNQDVSTDENEGEPTNNHEEVGTNDGGDGSTILLPGGLLTENPLPSRGDNISGHNSGSTEGANDGSELDTDTDSDNTELDSDTNTSNTTSENVLEDKWGDILEKITSYPNPAIGHINVQIPVTDQVIRIRLINLAGQSVMNRTVYGNSHLVLDTYSFPEGVYLLEFTGETKQTFRRVYIKK